MIEKQYIESVLGVDSTHAQVRKVGDNLVYDLVRKYQDADGNEVAEVLATDRTYESQFPLTQAELDELNGAVN